MRAWRLSTSRRGRFAKVTIILDHGGELDPYRFGVDASRPIREIIIDFCHQQKLIPRRIATASGGRK
jgi:hypothetical protein